MNKLVITPENEQELTFLKELMKKLGYEATELSEEDMEDLGLLKAMIEGKKDDFVSEETIKKALKE